MAERYTIIRRVTPTRPVYRSGTKALGLGSKPKPTIEQSSADLDEKQAAEIRQDPNVSIARGFRTQLIKPRYSQHSESDSAWGLDAVGAGGAVSGLGVVVAVLDTGIDASHDAFKGVDLREQDFTSSGNGDRNGHGTHCAGTIFGRPVGARRIGVAPGIHRALIGKVLDDQGSGDSTMIFDGLDWAFREGADIISMSIGFDFPGEVGYRVKQGWPPELATSEALTAFRDNLDVFRTTLDRFDSNGAFGKRPLVVAASGNESRRNEDASFRISASLPSSAMHLSVAALGQHTDGYKVADFSNGNAKIAAPGVDILSAAPGGGYATMSGTSMACPHVAGVAALWAEHLRTEGDIVNSENLKSLLLANASRSKVMGDVADVGRGMVKGPQSQT